MKLNHARTHLVLSQLQRLLVGAALAGGSLPRRRVDGLRAGVRRHLVLRIGDRVGDWEEREGRVNDGT